MEWSWQRLGPGPSPVILEEQAARGQLLSCGCTSNGASRDPQALQPTLECCLSGPSRLSDSVWAHAWPLGLISTGSHCPATEQN